MTHPKNVQNNARHNSVSIAALLCVFVAMIALISCSERSKPKIDPIGVWENTTHWDNNHITLTVRPDSTMLFKAEKSFCPGTKFFVSVGKWHIEQDSFLVMEQFTDSTHYELRELFPELMQTQQDSNNVLVLGVTARLIMSDSVLFDITPEGKRVQEHQYKKTGSIKN